MERMTQLLSGSDRDRCPQCGAANPTLERQRLGRIAGAYSPNGPGPCACTRCGGGVLLRGLDDVSAKGDPLIAGGRRGALDFLRSLKEGETRRQKPSEPVRPSLPMQEFPLDWSLRLFFSSENLVASIDFFLLLLQRRAGKPLIVRSVARNLWERPLRWVELTW